MASQGNKSDSLSQAIAYSKLALEKSDRGVFSEANTLYGLAIDCYNEALINAELPPMISELVNQHVVLLSRRVESLLKITNAFDDVSYSGSSFSTDDAMAFDSRPPSMRATTSARPPDRLCQSGETTSFNTGRETCSTISPSRRQATQMTDLRKEQEQWEAYFESISEKPNECNFNSLVGLSHLKALLATTLFSDEKSRYKHLVPGTKSKRPNILFHGYPGTGKTLIAKAYAYESRAPVFIPVTAADLLSKYVGESEVKLKALLAVAERLAGIIFIDEVDGLLGGEKDNKYTCNFINDFLIRVEKLQNVQVLAATNFPWRLHSAVIRRFQYILHVPLPSLVARVGMLEKSLAVSCPELSDYEWRDLGRITENFSGSDIERATQFANRLPALICQRSKYFKKVDVNGTIMYTPCYSLDSEAESLQFTKIPHDRILPPKLNHGLLAHVFKKFKPSSDPEDKHGSYAKMMTEFNKRFGHDVDLDIDLLLDSSTPRNDIGGGKLNKSFIV